MVSTRKKMQSNRGLLSQWDDSTDMFYGNTVSVRQENATVNESIGDQHFTVDNRGSNLADNETLMNVKTLKSYLNEWLDY